MFSDATYSGGQKMSKGRMAAFSDGVLAMIITLWSWNYRCRTRLNARREDDSRGQLG